MLFFTPHTSLFGPTFCGLLVALEKNDFDKNR